MKGFSTTSLLAGAGFAIFLVINATQVWGGVFPFLPQSFQTAQVTLVFYLAQSVSFALAYLASTVGSYYRPQGASRMLVGVATAIMFLGSVLIIAAMYVPAFTLQLVLAGGVFSGVGSAAFFMLWQRCFASFSPDDCNNGLLLGTAAGSLLYLALYLVPVALTAFLIPVVLLPLSALCLVLSVRRMDFEQPMFTDQPHKHPQVYKRLMRDLWRAAVSVAAIGFSNGLARGVAVSHTDISALVNIISMVGSLAAAVILLVLSRRYSFRFGLNRIFRFVFPVVMAAALVFPFIQNTGLSLLAGVMYLVFSLTVLVMMMQSAQICRDRGANPVFVYGFFGVAIYTAQSVGFLGGWMADQAATAGALGVGEAAVIALAAAVAMGMALFAISRGFAIRYVPEAQRENEVEFIAPERPRVRTAERGGASGPATHPDDAEHPSAEAEAGEAVGPAAAPVGIDPLERQCQAAQRQFGLTSREAEVMELIARGRSVAVIAEQLFISENTVRTHSKHIYTKLDIHSKNELAHLLDNLDLSEVQPSS